MTKKRNKITNWPRLLMQWAVIAVLIFLAIKSALKDSFAADFEAYCPFGGLQAIGSYLLNDSLACTMTSRQMVMGALLIVLVILFSKLFCSYICPVGTISEWLGKLGDKLKIRFTIKGFADKALRSLKYILLFITLYFTFASNELFCKEYDPFYAIVSGYDSDVKVLYATLAIAITVLGAIFIRLFWCKYLCPLGAVSNIFKFTFFFVGVMAIYILLLVFGLNISYVWPIAILSLGGYVIELIGHKFRLFPVAKITRNEDSCTNCQLCSIKCPQAIDVAKMEVVKDVDCNLCSECVTSCPEENTLQINKSNRLKWMPPVAIAALFALGLFLQSFWEIPTINQKWGDNSKIVGAATYEREGMKNIKCYGSSAAFASQMKKVTGVYGVATYVGSKKIEILYDSTVIKEAALEEAIFTPSKATLRALGKEFSELTEVSMLLENFFDAYDFSYLSRLLQQETNATAVLSEFGCPIKVKVFFPKSETPDLDALKEIIEAKTFTYTSREKEYTVELKYEVVGNMQTSILNKGEYVNMLFDAYKRNFNDFETFDSSIVKVYSIPMGKNEKLSKRLSYLVSHVSNDNGIIKLETSLNEEFKQMLNISYVDTLTNDSNIYDMICADSLSVTYTSGKKAKVLNMFDFSEIE